MPACSIARVMARTAAGSTWSATAEPEFLGRRSVPMRPGSLRGAGMPAARPASLSRGRSRALADIGKEYEGLHPWNRDVVASPTPGLPVAAEPMRGASPSDLRAERIVGSDCRRPSLQVQFSASPLRCPAGIDLDKDQAGRVRTRRSTSFTRPSSSMNSKFDQARHGS